MRFRARRVARWACARVIARRPRLDGDVTIGGAPGAATGDAGDAVGGPPGRGAGSAPDWGGDTTGGSVELPGSELGAASGGDGADATGVSNAAELLPGSGSWAGATA